MIIQTSHFSDLRDVLSGLHPHTLVVFDVDYVLLQPQDAILHPCYKNELEQFQRTSFLDEDVFYSTIFEQAKSIPVHPSIPGLIQDLQKQDIKVLALTHCCSNAFGTIPSMTDWRIQQLHDLNYHFEKSWPAIEILPLPPFPLALFKNGIIFSTYYKKGKNPERIDYEKGKTLEAFLMQIPNSFKEIIFIDDALENLHSVKNFCRAANLGFVGIEYTTVKNTPAPPLNREAISLQFKILAQERLWISDKEAINLLNMQHENFSVQSLT